MGSSLHILVAVEGLTACFLPALLIHGLLRSMGPLGILFRRAPITFTCILGRSDQAGTTSPRRRYPTTPPHFMHLRRTRLTLMDGVLMPPDNILCSPP